MSWPIGKLNQIKISIIIIKLQKTFHVLSPRRFNLHQRDCKDWCAKTNKNQPIILANTLYFQRQTIYITAQTKTVHKEDS